uniref:Uncharacterized protein n=1 Tax=Ditylenchus dipsaci TaxID=166011 RepID=A0A915D3B9_9BILA
MLIVYQQVNTLISPLLQDSYDESGEYNALDLVSYNLKKPQQSRKFLTVEEAKIIAKEAAPLVALKLQKSTESQPDSSTTGHISALKSTEENVAEEAVSFVSNSDAELDVESECSSTDTIQDVDGACSSNQSAEQGSNQLENAFNESTSAPLANSTTENHVFDKNDGNDREVIKISLLANKNGFRDIFLIESRKKTAILLKNINNLVEKCVQRLENEFLPFYENFVINQCEWSKPRGIYKEFSERVKNRPQRNSNDRPENRVIKFSIVKTNRKGPDSLNLEIHESFPMVVTDKDVNHEISVPASALPTLVQELRVALQEIRSERSSQGIVESRSMFPDISAADDTKLKAALYLTCVERETKRFIRISEAANSRRFVMLSIPVVIECIYNLNMCSSYYDNLESKEFSTCGDITFLMTRNVQCKESQGLFTVDLCVNQGEYLISIRDWQKRNHISVSANLIGSFVNALKSMAHGPGVCWKCSTLKNHQILHQCDTLSPPRQDTNNNIPKFIEHSADNHQGDSELNIYRPKDRFRAKANGRRSDQSEIANFPYNSCVGNFRTGN